VVEPAVVLQLPPSIRKLRSVILPTTPLTTRGTTAGVPATSEPGESGIGTAGPVKLNVAGAIGEPVGIVNVRTLGLVPPEKLTVSVKFSNVPHGTLTATVNANGVVLTALPPGGISG
jgi:hypothetical protein